MRDWTCLACCLLGIADGASAQRFGFTHQMVPVGNDDSHAVALGDVDGDGDLDVFVGNGEPWVGQQNRLYLNDGTGVLTDVSATNLPALADRTFSVAFGDVDGDGDLDAFVGNFNQLSRLYLNGGTGIFTDVTATNLPAGLGDLATAVALGDVDGDGDLDAFVGTGGGFSRRQNRLYLNGGTGVFTDVTATNLPALLDNSNAVALGDVDGDGDLDAFVGDYGWILLYLNAGTGVFTDVTATNLPLFIDQAEAIALGDVDGDGDLDAFIGTYGGPNRLYVNGGTGIFTDATAASLPALIDYTRAVALGDVDGDGDLDAFVGNDGQDRLHLNGGTGIFANVTATNLAALSDPSLSAALGDMDGDGDLDAVVGNETIYSAQQNRLYLNGGTGVFADVAATNLPTLIDFTLAVALGDVDVDGDLDAFTGNSGVFPSPRSRLYLNGGTGVFTDVTGTNLPTLLMDHSQAVALGDVDGDGDLDAFAGRNGPERLLLNGGTGLFTDVTATALPAVVDNTSAVALGDLDGDGDLDVFVGNAGSFGGQNRLYLNGGTGVFTDVTATNLPALVGSTLAVALGDVDGDGDLDAFVGNSNQEDRLYLNGGTGVFADVTATNFPTQVDFTGAVALGDVDGDGDLDAFVGNYGQESRLYLNGGTGIFTDVAATDLPAQFYATFAVALGDVDGDGDLDAYLGNNQQDFLYTNLSRQLTWRGIPRVGKPLTLDLRGPGNGTWLLAASAGIANIPLPPFGSLRLFPSTLFIAAGGPLDPGGQADLTFPVPANPALVGASLYWQAVVGPPLRFTNLEITALTSL